MDVSQLTAALFRLLGHSPVGFEPLPASAPSDAVRAALDRAALVMEQKLDITISAPARELLMREADVLQPHRSLEETECHSMAIDSLSELLMQRIEDAWKRSRDRSAMLLFPSPPRYALSAKDVRAALLRARAVDSLDKSQSSPGDSRR